MASYKDRTIKVDLGVTHRRDACSAHAKDGFDPGCEACDVQPYVAVPVPELKDFYVEVLNPRVLPYGRKKEIYRDADEDTPAARQARLERILTGLITAWNLVDAENGEQLPLPNADAGALDRAPDITAAVFVELGRRARESAVPKETATA